MGIRTKLTLPLLLAFCILAFLIQVVLVPAWKQQELEEVKQNQLNLLSALSPDISRHLLAGDYAALYTSIDEQMKNSEKVWLLLVLTNREGDQIYPLDTPMLYDGQSPYIFNLTSPISIGGSPLASIELTVDWLSIWDDRKVAIDELNLFLLVAFFGILILSLLIQNALIRRPLIRLESATSRFAKGDFSVELPVSSSKDEIGKLTRSFHSMRSDLKQSQEELKQAFKKVKEEEIRLRTIYDTIADGLLVIDQLGIIQSFNPAAEQMFGYSAKETVGQDIGMLMPTKHREQHGQYLSQFLTENKKDATNLRREVMGVRKNSDNFPIDINITKMDISGISYFNTIIRDVSEQKAIEKSLIESRQAAIEASKAKSEFLAKMSHEIRTPMNGVLGMTQLLAKTALSVTQKQHLDTIASSGDALMRIINDILDLSKIEAGSMTLEHKSFNLQRLVQGCISLFQANAQGKGIALELNYDTDTPHEFKGDSGRLNQVFNNIISNAIKFTEHGGITIEIKAPQVSLGPALMRITISDTGIGIPPLVQKSLFSPFMQADESTTRKYGGTGLGLAICKQLIELMKGTIQLESEEGKGSMITIDLQMERSESPPLVEQSTTTSDIALEANNLSGQILLVDDAHINQLVASSMLEGLGLEVTVAGDGSLAVDKFMDKKYDLIFMDCEMPKMDGYAATTAIREWEKSKALFRTPIIALTANAYEENRKKCLEVSMDDFLTKPFDEKDLIRVVKKWLKLSC